MIGTNVQENGKRSSKKAIPRKTKPREKGREVDWHIVKAIFFGLPSRKSTFWNTVTVAINVFLALSVVDMVYHGPMLNQSQELSFVRVGYVSETTAKLLIREPDPAQLPIYISYRNAAGFGADDTWKSAGTIFSLSNETDFSYSTALIRLWPSTRYQYAVSSNHTGFFTTAPPAGQVAPGLNKFTFLTSSCLKSRFPYNPFEHPLTIPGLKNVAIWAPSLHASFMLFLGDFIYVDVPHRFGTDAETYRREYRQVYSSPEWPAAVSLLESPYGSSLVIRRIM